MPFKDPLREKAYRKLYVRGILCNKCNLLLGIAADQHNYLTGLAQYLQTFNPEE